MPRRSHPPYFALLLSIATACVPLVPTPDELPPPWTPIVEIPTGLPSTATARPVLKPIFADDMSEARTFFLILKVAITAGDAGAIAERVQYPMDVHIGGQRVTIQSTSEFEANRQGILNAQFMRAVLEADEGDLELGLDGIKAAGGAIWFNQYCGNPACSEGKFLITQINN